MRYGELWRVSGLARDRYAVIVSADPINVGGQYPNVQGVPIVDELAAPTNLLIIGVTAPVAGRALIPDVGPTPKTRLTQRIGVVPDAELDEIRRGLSALFDL